MRSGPWNPELKRGWCPYATVHAARRRGEHAAEPALLRRAGAAAARRGAVRVQHDDLPGAEPVGVVAASWIARGAAEVAEVAGRARRPVLVVPDGRPRAPLEAAPRRRVAAPVLLVAAGLVDRVAEDGDGARKTGDEGGRGLVAARAARGDVARRDEVGSGCDEGGSRERGGEDHAGTVAAAAASPGTRTGLTEEVALGGITRSRARRRPHGARTRGRPRRGRRRACP